jgi:Methyltransferase domain
LESPSLRKRLKRSLRRVATRARSLARAAKLWVEPGHFYSPVPGAHEVADLERREPGPRELPGLAIDPEQMLELLRGLAPFHADFAALLARPEARYRAGNDLFADADAFVYFGLLSRLRPKRLIEVGSGFTSALALDANQHFLAEGTRLTFIDPHPRRLRKLVGDEPVDVIERRVQEVDPALFDALGAGDVLFVDSSHVSKLESDVNRLVLEIFPRLAPGVWVHVHDVGYPFEYPLEWAREHRGWNEAYLLRAFLCLNPAFAVRLWIPYLDAHRPAELADALPEALRGHPGTSSLWLERVH